MSDKIDNADEIDEMLSYGQKNGVPVNKLSSEHAIKTYQPTARVSAVGNSRTVSVTDSCDEGRTGENL